MLSSGRDSAEVAASCLVSNSRGAATNASAVHTSDQQPAVFKCIRKARNIFIGGKNGLISAMSIKVSLFGEAEGTQHIYGPADNI